MYEQAVIPFHLFLYWNIVNAFRQFLKISIKRTTSFNRPPVLSPSVAANRVSTVVIKSPFVLFSWISVRGVTLVADVSGIFRHTYIGSLQSQIQSIYVHTGALVVTNIKELKGVPVYIRSIRSQLPCTQMGQGGQWSALNKPHKVETEEKAAFAAILKLTVRQTNPFFAKRPAKSKLTETI